MGCTVCGYQLHLTYSRYMEGWSCWKWDFFFSCRHEVMVKANQVMEIGPIRSKLPQFSPTIFFIMMLQISLRALSISTIIYQLANFQMQSQWWIFVKCVSLCMVWNHIWPLSHKHILKKSYVLQSNSYMIDFNRCVSQSCISKIKACYYI